MGFSSYFLVVWDYIKFARENHIPVGPGRGSAAGSYVAYCLGITDIDPIENGLLFERFLNPERKSMPDIDSDFSVDGRDKVIEYVSQKYGSSRVAQIITFNRLTSKAVLKDVARVIGVPLPRANHVSKIVPVVRGKPTKLDVLISEASPSKEFSQMYENNAPVLPDTIDELTAEWGIQFQEWIDIARSLEGTNKTFGIHAAGVVISADPLHDLVPMARGKNGEMITQYAMDDIESLGLLKMDFLGLKNLSVIEKALEFIRERNAMLGIDRQVDFRTEYLELDDPKTYEFLANGELDGIFQLDASSGMRQIVRELKPTSLDDISSILALYRPGPLDAGLIPMFINRKHGKEQIRYDFPELEPILKETYGIIVYQEQIMRIAREVAGYSLGEADILRRAMGKKKKEVMEQEQNRFREGAAANGIDPYDASNLFETMLKFSEYCFNKSHSKAYALLTFQTAYLKAHYPVEFSAALLQSNSSVIDKLPRYLTDAETLGVSLNPPRINHSGLGFRPILNREDYDADGNMKPNSGGEIMFGLDAIKGVRSSAEKIIEEREKNGKFKDLADLCCRLESRSITKRTFELMAQCGALEDIHPNRKAVAQAVEPMLTLIRQHKKRKPLKKPKAKKPKKGEPVMEEMSDEDFAVVVEEDRQNREQELADKLDVMLAELSEIEDYTPEEKMEFEKTLLGFFVSDDPLSQPKVLELGLSFWLLKLSAVSGKSRAAGMYQVAEHLESEEDRMESGLEEHTESIRLAANGAEFLGLGLVIAVKELTTKKGLKMAKLSVEDFSGSCDAVLFPMVYEKVKDLSLLNKVVVFWGTIDRGTQFVQLVVDDLVLVNDARFLRITATSRSRAEDAKRIIESVLEPWRALRKKPREPRVPVLLEIVQDALTHTREGNALYLPPKSLSRIYELGKKEGVDEAVLKKFLQSELKLCAESAAVHARMRLDSKYRLPLSLIDKAAEALRQQNFIVGIIPGESSGQNNHT
mmetsp:Transcript_1521/g.2736  ORF Transcript_1521/g.2736 Transcript_1521/m.2736 type:complete len:983 (-) Transcript_1521:1264-4212(-)